ncbi:MAG: peptide-methionine (S)-S-oxide reductase [Butyrivibrio sp.]|nr:peptide-methionine (S)-S-oxide reductase [Butyrivibrio sp.]
MEIFLNGLPYKNFYEAEEYHQDYYLMTPES